MDKFFIVGCPRSGTTMVQQALNRHSGIVIPPETKYFFSFYGHPRACQVRHVERLNTDLGIRLPVPEARINSPSEGRAYYDLMAQQYTERLGKKDVVYFGEKTPEHTGHMHHIRELFPAAKIVVLYRDGRDVALSLTKVPWMSSNLYVNFLVWLYYQRVVASARDGGLSNLYFARYEDIVANPKRELGGILDFLGLPYEPAVAEGHGNREGVPEREFAWKERALEKITTARTGQFQQELDCEQIELLERLGRHALPALGYPLLTGGHRRLPLGLCLKVAFHLSRLVYRLPWPAVLKELLGGSLLRCLGRRPPQTSLVPTPA
jgi:sulfotransferase family protein